MNTDDPKYTQAKCQQHKIHTHMNFQIKTVKRDSSVSNNMSTVKYVNGGGPNIANILQHCVLDCRGSYSSIILCTGISLMQILLTIVLTY